MFSCFAWEIFPPLSRLYLFLSRRKKKKMNSSSFFFHLSNQGIDRNMKEGTLVRAVVQSSNFRPCKLLILGRERRESRGEEGERVVTAVDRRGNGVGYRR